MEINYQFDPFLFIKFEPSPGIGIFICIVLHGDFPLPPTESGIKHSG
jgi:hypothetical protein